MSTRCPNCEAPLTRETATATGGWDTSPGGDEFWDVLHECPDCHSWSMVTHVDRYAGPPEVKVRGPLSRQELEEQRVRLAESRISSE